MQLKIQRSQRMGGVMGTTVLFCLDVRAEYTPEEKANIARYKIGGQIIYSSQAARQHLESAGAHLDRTRSGALGETLGGLARGATSIALAKMRLNISIASLGRGHHVECKDLEELLETEDTVRNACKDLTRYLQVADTFDGGELVIDYVEGEEKVHITQGATSLLTDSSSEDIAYETNEPAGADYLPAADFGRSVREFWDNPRYRKMILIVGGALVVLFLLRSCV